MPFCPNCKSEYEEDINQCADCNIDLVESLDDAIMYVKLIAVTKEESVRVVEFLKYSNIVDIKYEDGENNQVVILVNEKDAKESVKLLRVYLVEEAKEDQDEHEDDYFVDEYKTEDLSSDEQMKEMQSSYISFLVVGVLLEIFCVLNLFGILNIITNKSMIYMFIIVGFVFFVIGISTKRKMPSMIDDTHEMQDQVNQIVQYFEEKVDLERFYEMNDIKVEDYNEGALYFVAIDIIKNELSKQFPDVKESILNTASEEIYNKL